jgi:membrane protease YdiL (CAAX protease family)
VKEKSIRPGVLLAVLCMCAGSQMVNSLWVGGLEVLFNLADKSLMPLLEAVSGESTTFSMFLYASILAPIAEELLFRGYILRTLRPYGKKFAIFGSALLFGLFHGNLLQTPYAFLMGLLLGWLTVEYSVVWAILVHMFNNLVLADLLTRLTAGLPMEVAGMISMSLMGGCLVVSCVILTVKHREVADYLHREWMDRRVLKCFFTNAGILLLTAMMLVNILLMLP